MRDSKRKKAHSCIKVETTNPAIVDVSLAMRENASKLANIDMSMSTKRIWNAVSAEVDKVEENRGKAIKKASLSDIRSTVENFRRPMQELDLSKKIKKHEYAKLGENDERLFLKFYFEYESNNPKIKKKHELCKIIIWGHPDLIPILKRRSIPLYLNATFKCVPNPFTQLLIMMAYDDETELYLPILFWFNGRKIKLGILVFYPFCYCFD